MPQGVILIRHGEYDGNFLTTNGEQAIKRLAAKIKSIIYIESCITKIISSTSPRAFRSANILAQGLDLERNRDHYECLRSEKEEIEDPEGIFELIDKKYADADILIIVTHAPVCQKFPALYAERHNWEPEGEFYCDYAGAILLHIDDRFCAAFT